MKTHIRLFLWLAVLAVHVGLTAQSNPGCSVYEVPAPPTSGGGDVPGIVDYTWSCNQERCTFAPVISDAGRALGVKDIDWLFEPPAGVHAHSYTLKEIVHYYPVSFVDTTYRPRVVFTFFSGNTVTIEHDVVIRVAAAKAYWAENNVQAGLSVFLEPSDAELNWVQYRWDFGDGTNNDDPVGGYARSVFCKTYDQPGQKTVTLTTYDYRAGDHTVPVIDSFTKTFYVTNFAPVADGVVTVQGKTASFNASRSVDEVPAGHVWDPRRESCITLTPMSNASLSVYEWDFGDGSYGSGVTASHTYERPGRKTVNLSVKDRAGAVSKKAFTVDVADAPPFASVAFNCSGRTCQFDGSRSQDDFNAIGAYNWSFGGVAQSQPLPSTSYTFPADGDYVVTLAVRDEVQSSPPASRIVSVRSTAPSPALGFVGITPCRAYDSRGSSAGPLVSGQERVVDLTRCGVPPDAKAAAVDVTAIAPSNAGHIRAFATGISPAPDIPVMSFDPVNAPVVNNVVVATSPATSQQLSLIPYIPTGTTKAGTMDATVDITGYFTDSTTALSQGYVPVTPCRLMDTRDPATYPGAAPVGNGTWSYLKIQGKCGVPADAGAGAAAALNLTVVGATQGGNFLFSPSSQLSGSTSSLNFRPNINLSNGVLLLLGRRAGDDAALYYLAASPATTNYVMDLTGYFKSTSALKYRAIQPCRLADTRIPERGEASLAGGTPAGFQVRGNCGIPASAVAVFVNAYVLSASGFGHFMMWPTGSAAPATSVLNFQPGMPPLSNGTIVSLGTSEAGVMRDLTVMPSIAMPDGSRGSAHVLLDVYGYFTTNLTAQPSSERE